MIWLHCMVVCVCVVTVCNGEWKSYQPGRKLTLIMKIKWWIFNLQEHSCLEIKRKIINCRSMLTFFKIERRPWKYPFRCLNLVLIYWRQYLCSLPLVMIHDAVWYILVLHCFWLIWHKWHKMSFVCSRLVLSSALARCLWTVLAKGLIIETSYPQVCAHKNLVNITCVSFLNGSHVFSIIFLQLPLLPLRSTIESSHFTQMCIDIRAKHTEWNN